MILLVSAGGWGEGSSGSDCAAVGLRCRIVESRTEFMVVDAESTPWGNEELLGEKLTRDQVLGTRLSKLAFQLVDEVVAQDERLRDALQSSRERPPPPSDQASN